MFLQIRIREEDRDYLRFLWRSRPEEEPTEWRMTSLPFGTACSPCIAIYVKNANANEYAQEHPEAATAIVRSHYMDDYLQSFEDEDRAVRVAAAVKEIHAVAHFEIRGWASNSPVVAEALGGGAGQVAKINAGSESGALGLRWHTQTDQLAFSAGLRTLHQDILNGDRPPTKREVLSAVMGTFDPLGLAAPILVQGKKLVQEMWRSQIGWDDSIPAALQSKWEEHVAAVRELAHLRIARCVSAGRLRSELHCFCDASLEAYAAAVYIRSEDESGQVSVALLAAKARVAPLKQMSVPRLELQAALLGARLAESLRKESELAIARTTFWTDSTTVLSWVKADPRQFKTFVAHRLAEIEETTKPEQWRWVPTALNVADDATRAAPVPFTAEHRWFRGPDFLWGPMEDFPEDRGESRASADELERRTIAVTAAASTVAGTFATPDPLRFSKWERLLRATARVIQFIERIRPGHVVSAIVRRGRRQQQKVRLPECPRDAYVRLEVRHLQRAETELIKRAQMEDFPDELRRIRRGEQPSTGGSLSKLEVALDTAGVLRLRGRINAARNVAASTKAPAVLSGRSHIARLLIEHHHRKLHHGHHAAVINEIRQFYWVLGLRGTVRRIAQDCSWCKLRRRRAAGLPVGDLPHERLAHGEPPFSCTGVDYFGPMTVTVGRRTEKRWGVLFTCLTTRAVHLEISATLTADSMLMALRRFISRRGAPRVLWSDNGTNFTAANKELRKELAAVSDGLQRASSELNIEWRFIPPGAPHMGGSWERMVRTVKTALAATLRERRPREEVLHTLLLEVEQTVNSRPLTEPIADPESEESLTPNHFLLGRSSGQPPSIQGDIDVGRPSWRAAQRLADHFWRRWVREYLPTLVPRAPARTHDNLEVGDVVIIADGTLPRNYWPRGEIERTYPGPDGRTRIADVRTTAGTLRRPVKRMTRLIAAATRAPTSDDPATC